MANPSASIVIPVYNRAHLVHRAIDSALAQSHPCEILVVDHGSTDDIGSVINRYGNQIRYIRRETDNGPIEAWRDGAEQATGEYLHFTYDDDWIQPDFMEKCIAHLRSDVAFVYTRVTLHGAENRTRTKHLVHPPGTRSINDIVKYFLSLDLTISPGCAVFRRSDVLKYLLSEIPGANGIYGKRSGVGEDLLLFLLTSLHYPKYAHINEYLADFLAHDGSITINAIESGRFDKLKKAYRLAKDYYLEQPGAIKESTLPEKFIFKIKWIFFSLYERQ